MAILLAGFDQPLVLVVIAASLIRGVRLAALVWAFGFFGVFSVILVKTEFAELL